MKPLLPLLIGAVFTALFTSCGNMARSFTSSMSSAEFEKTRPLHIGKVIPVKYDAYHVQVYDRSVVFLSTTQIIYPAQVQVFDVDHNGRFDSVFLYSKDSWLFGTTKEFEEKYNIAPKQSLPNQAVLDWIYAATDVKKIVKSSHSTQSTLPEKNTPQQTSTAKATEATWWSPQ